jgi:hypothetical protein
LLKKLEKEAFTVKQAQEDGDILIIASANDIGQHEEQVVIVGEDTGLTILLTAHAPSQSNNYFLKPGKGKAANLPYTTSSLKFDEHVRDNILFLHAFSGCDTTSAFFKQWKMKFLKLLNKKKQLGQVVSIFKDQNASQDNVDKAGQRIIAFIYGVKSSEQTSLDALRYKLFAQSIIKIGFNLASLPPTTAAACQHSLRTYQSGIIMVWEGKKISSNGDGRTQIMV